MKSARILLAFFLWIGVGLGSASVCAATDPALLQWQKLRDDPKLRAELQAWLESEVRFIFQGENTAPPMLSEFFQRSIPLFVTMKKGETVRGCMGSLQSRRATLAEEIRENLRRAGFQDPWHREVLGDEMPGMTIYLTAVGKPRAVRDIGEISPANDGALLRQGNREAVVLPGEAKTQRYLLAFLLAKSGANPKQPYHIYRIKTLSVAFTIPAESGVPKRN